MVVANEGQPIESELKYIIVEAVKADEKNLIPTSIETGLFQGMKNERLHASASEPELSLLLRNKDDVLRILCLTYYNIVSLERFDGSTKVTTYFRASGEDQKKAQEMAQTLVNELKLAQRTMRSDEDIIDIGTYTLVPEKFGVKKTEDSNSTGTTYSRFQGQGQGKSNLTKSTTGTTVHKPYVKKEPEPLIFRRTGKKPTKVALQKMQEKIVQIAAGELTIPIPEIEGDAEEKKNSAINDDYAAEYFHCG